ncbi:MAG: hypothetical protein GF355_04375 [Candidatus Eisenbacteria bacterium]|nr:hypothetical protein [Candidatus Eisenbacteria bacterium]
MAHGFLLAIGEAIDRLTETPDFGSPTPGVSPELGARSVMVKRFPYSVVYVDHQTERWIVAFAHQRRRPGYWRDRKLGGGCLGADLCVAAHCRRSPAWFRAWESLAVRLDE